MSPHTTIAAIATAPGRGGIGIVRVSGHGCRAIAEALLGRVPAPRTRSCTASATRRASRSTKASRSSSPGPRRSPARTCSSCRATAARWSWTCCCAACSSSAHGAAEPGEFTQRAFLNDKLDLAQAEAVADLIDSGSAQAARAALRSLPASSRRRCTTSPRRCSSCACGSRPRSTSRRRRWTSSATARSARGSSSSAAASPSSPRPRARATLLRDGLTIVIAGRPNAGKSSLLNRLAGYDAAIVTPMPGTTRDVLRERIEIDGLPLHVLDTAGLRESPDEVEAEGIRRAHRELARADRVLFVVDASDAAAVAGIDADLAALPTGAPRTVVFNKIDRIGGEPRIEAARARVRAAPQRGHRRRPRPAAPAPQGLRRFPPDRRRRALGAHPASRRAASRPRARRGSASAARRAARRRTGGAGTDRRPEAARRDHRRGDERRPARADLRELLHRQVTTVRLPATVSGN